MTPRARLRALPTFADHAKAFGSVDAMLLRLSAGWIHEQQGDPVFRNPADGLWYDIPEALGGWIALWERLSKHYDLALDFAPLLTLNARHLLYAGFLLLRKQAVGRKTAIPFGPFLSLGIATSILVGDQLLAWYFSFLLG